MFIRLVDPYAKNSGFYCWLKIIAMENTLIFIVHFQVWKNTIGRRKVTHLLLLPPFVLPTGALSKSAAQRCENVGLDTEKAV